MFAKTEKRVIVTHDDDLLVLAHQSYKHFGITYCRKDSRSVGEIIRLLILLYEIALPDEMKDRIEYLWCDRAFVFANLKQRSRFSSLVKKL